MERKKKERKVQSGNLLELEEKEKIIKISIKNLVKIYKQGKIEVVALRGLKAVFYPGITCILGPSGCGKTTLLNLIGGLDNASAGNILIGHQDITKFSTQELDIYHRHNVGFVFQASNLVPTLSGEENIELSMKFIEKPKPERKNRITELLTILEISDRKKHRPDELSGGEQQRFAIASALAHDPSIILFDEPTGELDSKSRDSVLKAIAQVVEKNPDKILIIATHDQSVLTIADFIYYIEDGLLVEALTKNIYQLRSKITSSTSENRFDKLKELNQIRQDLDRVFEKIQKLMR